jgi:hypothetical protein
MGTLPAKTGVVRRPRGRWLFSTRAKELLRLPYSSGFFFLSKASFEALRVQEQRGVMDETRRGEGR